jgi:prolyl-tRNA synthetase
MGCYGIGISRILAAAIEQSNDEKGIIWPLSITPFIANIILTNTSDSELKTVADNIYKDLRSNGIEVSYDDREARAGIKFKDSDLIGIPLKIIIGKKYKEEKKLEVEYRKTGEKKIVTEEQIKSLIDELK